HSWRASPSGGARWAQMMAPQPRSRFGGDTYFVDDPPQELKGQVIDVRDPRTRSFGHIEPSNMDVSRQTQDQLAVSASMRTALLVYSGITVKMMLDGELGAQHSTMFMVQYDPNGVAGQHDHPFEETYLILDGEVDATFDGERYRMTAGDIGLAGVVCVHGFANPAKVPVRWLESQAPQPPARTLLPVRPRLGLPSRAHPDKGLMPGGTVLIVGGTHGLGLELAKHFAGKDGEVVVTGRDPQRAASAAREIGHGTRGLGFDLAEPATIAPALKDVGPLHHLVLAAIERDENKIREYDVSRA